MDQESDDFDQSDDSSREDEHTHSNSVTNSNSIVDLPIHQLSSPFYTKTTKVSTFSLLFTWEILQIRVNCGETFLTVFVSLQN